MLWQYLLRYSQSLLASACSSLVVVASFRNLKVKWRDQKSANFVSFSTKVCVNIDFTVRLSGKHCRAALKRVEGEISMDRGTLFFPPFL